MPDADVRISFAHNARTICIAFVALASRYYQGNVTELPSAQIESSTDSRLFDLFSNIGDISHLFPPEFFQQKDKYDDVLYNLFYIIINAGIKNFKMELRHDPTLNATNYLKKDKNYYTILTDDWYDIQRSIRSIFDKIM